MMRVRGVADGLAWMRGAMLACLVATSMGSSPASAQLFFSRRLPPGQIITIVQSRGYSLPSYPYYRGDIYVVDATEPRGNRVRLVIDPNSGEIVERLLIRQQRVIPGPGFDDTYVRSGVPRIVNPSEEAAGGPKIERPRIKRAARRPAEHPAETGSPSETPAAVAPTEQPPQAAVPKESAPKDTAPAEGIARPTRPVATPRETPAAPVAAAPSAPAPSTAQAAPPAETSPAPGSPERGTKANPRRVGPVLPPAVGVE